MSCTVGSQRCVRNEHCSPTRGARQRNAVPIIVGIHKQTKKNADWFLGNSTYGEMAVNQRTQKFGQLGSSRKKDSRWMELMLHASEWSERQNKRKRASKLGRPPMWWGWCCCCCHTIKLALNKFEVKKKDHKANLLLMQN